MIGLRSILELPALEVAPLLLGRLLTTAIDGRVTAVRIAEVEAYEGADDPASHAHRGPTPRTTPMFGPPGTLYVYRSYGVHWCMNVVCRRAGVASAVLLRAGVPVEGVEVMVERRGRADGLADGPGKLTQALGVDDSFGGSSVFDGPARLSVERLEPVAIERTPRIGISRATDRPWRFVARL